VAGSFAEEGARRLLQSSADLWLVDQPYLETLRSTDSSGTSDTRRNAFEYDDTGMLRKVIREPGAKTSAGFQALPDQEDGVRTQLTAFDYTPEGLPELVARTDMTTGETRFVTMVYDPNESMFPIATADTLGHTVERLVEPSLGSWRRKPTRMV